MRVQAFNLYAIGATTVPSVTASNLNIAAEASKV